MEVLIEHNKVVVSSLDNPFRFPSDTRYSVGNGVVMATSAMVMNVTDRNFGSYPVYVFTTDGVFVLGASTSEVLHSRVDVPISIEAPISGVVCPTPYGIAYIAEKGLMIINQYRSICVSDESFGRVYRSKHYSYPELAEQGYIIGMYYLHTEDEIRIITSKGDTLVYGFRPKQFWAITGEPQLLVENGYPYTYVIYKDGVVRNETDLDPQKSVWCQLTTNPITLGSSDVKGLLRLILRGWFSTWTKHITQGLRIWHSNSGDNMYPEIPQDSEEGNKRRGDTQGLLHTHRDIDTGLLVREKYRYYSISFQGWLAADTSIDTLELMIGRVYNNKGMR